MLPIKAAPEAEKTYHGTPNSLGTSFILEAHVSKI
jgi:hypothetical protein